MAIFFFYILPFQVLVFGIGCIVLRFNFEYLLPLVAISFTLGALLSTIISALARFTKPKRDKGLGRSSEDQWFELAIGFLFCGCCFSGIANSEYHKQRTQSEMVDFSSAKVPELKSALIEIAQTRNNVESKIQQLTTVLVSLNKSTRSDPDLAKLKKFLADISSAEENLKTDLEEAFVLYKKCQIMNDKASEERFAQIIANAKKAGNDIQDRYKSLKNSLSN